jgi:uncharacterized coiled-coil DUF342 family protein
LADGSEVQSDKNALGWDDLVAQKRKLSNELKAITEALIDIDKNQLHRLAAEIREKRTALDAFNERLRQIRNDVEKNNSDLLLVSEKISQSKNFLSIMEARLPSEDEESLQKLVQDTQIQLSEKKYGSERQKNEIKSRSMEASMKLEAVKATRTIRDQLSQLNQESSKIGAVVLQLDSERDSIRSKLEEVDSVLDKLYASKRRLSAERESALAEYDRIAHEFDLINARLDSMAEMRRKQRQEYGHGLPSDALFRVKETARKKLESGGKLSLDELKLLYGESE